MVLDNIQAVEEERRIKSDEKVSANSIKFKPDSLERSKAKAALIAKRDAAMEIVSEAIAQDVERGRTERIIKDKHFDYAAKIIALDDQIDILDKPEGTVAKKQATANRAIRLIKTMYANARANAEAIYDGVNSEKEPATEAVIITPPQIELPVVEEVAPTEPVISTEPVIATEPVISTEPVIATEPVISTEPVIVPAPAISTEPVIQAAPVVPAAPVVATEPVIDVKQIAASDIDLNDIIENAINSDNVISDADISDVIDEPIVVEPVVKEVAPTEPFIDVKKVESIANEKIINDRINENMKNFIEEKEYVPMTDEEIAKSQENIELEKYNAIYADAERKAKEVNEINNAKDFNFEEKADEPIRDEIVVVPEREEKEDVKEEIEEYVTEKEEEKVEPRSIVASEEVKGSLEEHKEESIEELARLIEAEEETKKAREKQRDDSEAELKKAKEDREKLLENESNTEQKLAELQAERERKEKELQELKVKLNKKLKALKNKNISIENEIQKNQEEISEIKEDTGRRNEHLDSLNGEVMGEGNAISDIDEMLAKYGIDDDDTYESKTK